MSDLTEEQHKQLSDLRRKLNEGITLIDSLIGGPKKKDDKDRNGEPNWQYAVKVSLPKDFYLTKLLQDYAVLKGLSNPEIEKLEEDFVSYYHRSGTKWAHWGKVWQKWVRGEVAKKRKQRAAQTSGLPQW